jgi:AcrR family transcriptional regulator
MSRKVRPEAEVLKVKQSLLDNALSLIHENSYYNFTLRTLAKKVGMTAGNVYYYFSSKDEIFLHLVIEGFKILYNKLKDATDKETDLNKKVSVYISTYYQFSKEYEKHYDLMFTLPTPKYFDYIGTNFESLAKQEIEYSSKIAGLAQAIISELKVDGQKLTENEVNMYCLKIWCQLHGMISLSRSKVISYVVTQNDYEDYFRILIQDLSKNFK